MIVEDLGIVGSQRLFYNLLLRVGALGKYQYISLVVWAVIYMLSSSVAFFNPFLFYQHPYTCTDLTDAQCTTMVCQLPPELRSIFLNMDNLTLIDKFGDYRCEDGSTLKIYQSIIYLSGVVGIMMGAYLNTFVRKKVLLEIAEAVSFFLFCLMLVISNIVVAIVSICIIYAMQFVVSDLVICFITETVLQEKRGKHIIVVFIFYSFGSLLNGVLFKFFQWQSIFIFYFIVPIVLTFIGIKWYIKETPFDLVTNFTPEEAYADFHWIAIQNSNQDSHEITIEQLRVMRQEYQENLRLKEQNSFQLLDLVRFKSLRVPTICCCIMHFFIYYSFSAPLLAVEQFTADLYINEIVFSSASLLSAVLCYFFMDNQPRKKMVTYTTIISCFFIVPTLIASNCQVNCGELKLIQSVSIFIFRLLMQCGFQAFYFIQNEIFPTQVRALAIFVTAVTGNLSSVFVPMVANINQSYSYFLPCTFAASAVIIVIATTQIPQTLGVPPPEIIPELENDTDKNFQ